MSEKKQRKVFYECKMANSGNSFEFGVACDEDGTLHIKPVTEVSDSHVTSQYERAKKPKILSKVSTGNRVAKVSINKAITDYDQLLAIDTNTKEVAGHALSVTAVVIAKLRALEKGRFVCQYEIPAFIAFTSQLGPPERLGWVFALKELLRSNRISQNSSIGMIVDSDLGLLPEFNSRKMPLIGNEYLLGCVELLYGSADTGSSELIPNRLIKEADKVSSRILKEYADGERVLDLRIIHGNLRLTYETHWLNTSAEAVQHQDPAAGSKDA
jgi:hypothetical protein